MVTLGVWTHSLESVAFRIGPLAVHWYGLAYLAGFVIATIALRWMAGRGLVRFEKDRVLDLVLSIGLFGVFVGGRVGYVLLYRQDLITDFSNVFPYWGVLRVQEGGMASHGGMIGVLLVLWWSARRMKVSMVHLLDAFCLVAPAGLMLGRIANFVNGELLGRIIVQPSEFASGATAPWYGVRFWQELMERPGEIVWSPEQQMDLVVVAQSSVDEPFEQMCARLAVWWQQNAGDGEVRRLVEPLLSVRHPSQLYQALAEGVVLGAVLWWIWRKPRRDGVIFAWFLMVYGVGRIATEFWRLPDAHLGTAARIAGLSRGQWLSAMMVAGGVGVLVWALRRKDAPTSGGWCTLGASKTPAPAIAETGAGDDVSS